VRRVISDQRSGPLRRMGLREGLAPPQCRTTQPFAVGRTMISLTSASDGWAIANATARAIASGGGPVLSALSSSRARTAMLVTRSAKLVRLIPGDMTVTRGQTSTPGYICRRAAG
jgi:hypothetical protein